MTALNMVYEPSPKIYRQYLLAVEIYQGLDEDTQQLVHDMYKVNRRRGTPTGSLSVLNHKTYMEAMKPALMHYGRWPGEDHPSPLDQAAEEYLEIIALQDHVGADI